MMQKRIPLALAAAAVLLCASQARAEMWLTSHYSHPAGYAAHKTLPKGTTLRVTNPKNGRSVRVIINDRGPYIRGRQLDLSRSDAKTLGFLETGVTMLEVERLN